MKKNNRNLFIGAFAVIGVGAYLIYKFATKNKPIGMEVSGEKSKKEEDETKKETKKETKTLGVAYYPLKKGSVGSNVQTLQKWLNDKGYANPKLIADGVFGAKTEIAVKNLQENANEKIINDYFSKAMWGSDYSLGQISKDFYDVFIAKTKKPDTSYSVGNVSSSSTNNSSSSASTSSSTSSPFGYVSPFGGGFKF